MIDLRHAECRGLSCFPRLTLKMDLGDAARRNFLRALSPRVIL